MTEKQRKERRNKVLDSLAVGFAIFLSILFLDLFLGEEWEAPQLWIFGTLLGVGLIFLFIYLLCRPNKSLRDNFKSRGIKVKLTDEQLDEILSYILLGTVLFISLRVLAVGVDVDDLESLILIILLVYLVYGVHLTLAVMAYFLARLTFAVERLSKPKQAKTMEQEYIQKQDKMEALSFPITVKCNKCKKVMKVTEPKKGRCPHCKAIFVVDEAGTITDL